MKKKRYAYMVGGFKKWFPVGEPIPLHCGFDRYMSRRFPTSGEAHSELRGVLETGFLATTTGFLLKRKSGGRWYVVHIVEK